MLVHYPGPVVGAAERARAQIHPEAGLLVVGENELPDEVAERLIASGLVEASRPAIAPPMPAATTSTEAPRPARRRERDVPSGDAPAIVEE